MASPTASQIAQLRYWVPVEWTPTEKFTTGAIFQAWAQYPTVHGTALALCRLKLAIAMDEPDTFSVVGEYSQSKASAVAALRKVVEGLQLTVLEEGAVAAGKRELRVIQMVRVGGPKR